MQIPRTHVKVGKAAVSVNLRAKEVEADGFLTTLAARLVE